MLRSQVEVHILNVYQGPHLFQNRRDVTVPDPTCHSHPWKPWAVLVGCTLRSFLTSSYRFPGNKLSRETGALSLQMCGAPFSFPESEKQPLSIVSLCCGWDHPLSLGHSSSRCKIVPLEARGQHAMAYRTPLAHHLFYIGYKLKIIFYIFKR